MRSLTLADEAPRSDDSRCKVDSAYGRVGFWERIDQINYNKSVPIVAPLRNLLLFRLDVLYRVARRSRLDCEVVVSRASADVRALLFAKYVGASGDGVITTRYGDSELTQIPNVTNVAFLHLLEYRTRKVLGSWFFEGVAVLLSLCPCS